MNKIILCTSVMLLGALALENINVEGCLKPLNVSDLTIKNGNFSNITSLTSITVPSGVPTNCSVILEGHGLEKSKIRNVNDWGTKSQLKPSYFRHAKSNECIAEGLAMQAQEDYDEKQKGRLATFKKVLSGQQSTGKSNEQSYDDYIKAFHIIDNFFMNRKKTDEDTKRYLIIKPNVLKDSISSLRGNSWKTFSNLNVARIPKIVTSVKDKCFLKCSEPTRIIIPTNVSCLKKEFFVNCTNLSEIIIPSSVSSLGEYCFVECTNLREITISTSVTNIGKCCFFGCSSLNGITIPSSVFSIEECCFVECTNLREITIPTSVTNIGKCCFFGCSSLNGITIPSSVSFLENFCFRNCTNLSKIIIPTSVTSIGKCCFAECSNLSEIIIPSNVSSLGEYCFFKCTNLKEITISASVTSIGKCCFARCSSLNGITIPSSVSYIGDGCFWNCNELKTIELPSQFVNVNDKKRLKICESISFSKERPNPEKLQ